MKPEHHKHARILERREARYRRSKKLRRILFYVFIIGTTATLRLNPDITNYASKATGDVQLVAVGTHSNMLQDRVKVRRGIGNNTEITPQNSNTLAQNVEQALKDIQAGQ